ncbi:hypothetical protein [Arthrobacter sp. NPDC090010]|uniref:hypothetical protein n=1 Tax=Arthrobacter sp. NPDC090010 TaxID=3363942 RepID=UPI0037F9894B
MTEVNERQEDIMPGKNNAGQFGQRADTTEQARRGGKASTGHFGSPGGPDAREAGRRGAAAQPREAKVRGGENSHRAGDRS